MTTQVDQTIAACYVAFFGRSPDQQGLQFWEAASSGLTNLALAQQVAAGFANNPSFASTYGGMGNNAFVTAIYENITGTAPDANGLQYWVNELNAGTSQADVVAQFIYGVLNMSSTAIAAEVAAGTITQAEADAATSRTQILNNKVAVALAYTSAMGAGSNMASSTNQSSLASLQNDPAYLASHAILNGVTADASSVTAAETYLAGSPTNAGIITQFGNGASVPGNTYTLTTGVDNINAAGGGAVINGVVGTGGVATGANDTVNPLDSIKATGANNTLNIVDQYIGSEMIPTITVSGVQAANIAAVGGVTVNTSSWTGLNTLNISASTGADAVTAAGTTAVNVTNTLATGALAAAAPATSINGGSTVNLTATGTSAAGSTFIGGVNVGQTAGAVPTGAVTVTDTQTSGVAGTTFGNIAVTGAASVTVNATENTNSSTNAAGTISATGGATGVVTVNSTTNVTDTTVGQVITGAVVTATGGSSVVVNEVVTASAAANLATGLAGTIPADVISAQDGAVTVIDGGTAASVTVNQTVTAAVAAKAAQLATAGAAGAAGGPGYSAGAATPATAATAAVPGAVAVVANTVAIGGAGTTNLLDAAVGNASNTITSVSLDNYGANSFINSTVLSNVTLAGSGTGGLTVENLGATPFTTLNVNLNGFTDAAGLTIASVDTTGDVKTLNVVTGGATASTLGAITDTALTTLNVSGTQTLDLTVVPTTLKTLTVTGTAGFNGDIHATAITAFDPTSSGTITVTLNGAAQSFTGSTGQDIVTLATGGDFTKAITAGSASNNEVILNGAAPVNGATPDLTDFVKNVTGFTTLGVADSVADVNAYDLSVLKGFTAIDVVSGPTATFDFTKVTAGTALSIDNSVAGVGYTTSDANGVTESVALSLGGATTTGIDVSSLSLVDANGNGIGTLNVVSNGVALDVNTIDTLADAGLAALNVSGNEGLTITNALSLDASATALTISNTSAGAVTFANGISATNLGSVTVTGSGDVALGTLTETPAAGHTDAIVSITNHGTGTVSLNSIVDTTLTNLTLTGNVALGADALGGPAPAAAAATGTAGVSFTLSAASDDAHVNFTLAGAAAGATDSITLGNGNDLITDGSTAGTVNVTVGTGSNLIDLHTGSVSTYAATVTLGAHSAATGVDEILVGTVAGNVSATATHAQTDITGAVKGDIIGIAGFTGAVESAAQTALAQTAVNALTGANNTLATAITTAAGFLTAGHDAIAFQFAGNTYVVEEATNVPAGTVAVGDTIVELNGVHTIAAGTAGHIVLAS